MGRDPVDLVARTFRMAGPDGWMLEWRDKAAPPKDLYVDLLALDLALGSKALPVVVNDRADIALALGFGVHLTETSLPTRVVRSLLPAGFMLGRSTHDLHSAVRAEAEGADYVVFGPVFDTPSKRSHGEPQGLAALGAVCHSLRIPVLAIGGIDVARVADCVSEGAHGVAAIRAIWEAESPAGAIALLREEVRRARA